MANVLYKLSLYFDNAYYEKVALQMLYNIIPAMDYPSAFSNWLNLWLDLGADNRELAICGINAKDAARTINAEYLPHILLAGSEKDSAIPLLKNRFAENRLLFYVCQNKACGLPLENIVETLNDITLK